MIALEKSDIHIILKPTVNISAADLPVTNNASPIHKFGRLVSWVSVAGSGVHLS